MIYQDMADLLFENSYLRDINFNSEGKRDEFKKYLVLIMPDQHLFKEEVKNEIKLSCVYDEVKDIKIQIN